MDRRAALLSLGSIPLVGCAGGASRREELPIFGPFTTPPRDGRVILEVRFHDPREIREVCRKLAGWPEGSQGAPACISGRFSTDGSEYLHVARPTSWEDHDVLIQIGHEVLHALKAEHR